VDVTQERRSEVKTDAAGVVELATIVLRPQTVCECEYSGGGDPASLAYRLYRGRGGPLLFENDEWT